MKKMNQSVTVFTPAMLILFILMAGCSPPVDGVIQYSTIDALLAGSYDGFVRLEELDRVSGTWE